MKNVVPVFS